MQRILLAFVFTLSLLPHLMVRADNISFLWLSDVDSYLSEQKRVPSFDIDGSTFRVMKKYLSGYEHTSLVVNNERSFQILKSGQLACAAKKLRTEEREAFGYFTDLPQMVFPGLRLYMRPQDAADAAVVNEQSYALDDFLLLSPTARLGIVKGRHYGAGLSEPIARWHKAERLYARSGNDMAAGLLDMLMNNRVDLVIEYPNVMHHYLTELALDTPLVSVKLLEAPEHTTGYVFCTRSAEGQALTQAMNEALRQASQDRAFLEVQLEWFDPSIHAEMTRIYNLVYNTQF